MTERPSEHFDVVVVGGGPRAVALIERLTARLTEQARLTKCSDPATTKPAKPIKPIKPAKDSTADTGNIGTATAGSTRERPEKPLVRVAVVDAVEVGPGATWRTDQTGQFLNNTPISETTLYPDESTPIDGPLGGGPTLVEWVREVAERGTHELPWVVEEARGLTPDSFSSRRLQGVYYAEQLARAEAAGFVSVERVIGVAQKIEGDGAGTVRGHLTKDDDGTTQDDVTGHVRTVRLANGRRLRGRMVVLAQGMVQATPSPSVRTFIEGSKRLGLRYIEPGMPSERPWHRVPAGQDCIVRGLGANFFDVVAELTAARGGRFEPVPGDALGRLRYIPSGKEPRLWAVSRRGVPYRAKGLAGPQGKPRYGQAVFATPEWFDSLEHTVKPLRFGRDVWPSIAAEFGYAFAAALAARDPKAISAGIDALREDLRAVIAGTGIDPNSGRTVRNGTDEAGAVVDAVSAVNNRIDEILATHINRPEGHPEAFRLDHLLRPTGGRRVSEEEWDRYVADFIEVELNAIAHPLESPRQAVNLAMAALRGRVAQLIAKGLIEGRSAVTEVHGWFESNSIFLASGPPAGRVRQVIALIEAGFVHFVGPLSTVEIDEFRRCFTALSPITGVQVDAHTFIEARMSKGNVTHTSDPLIQSLLATGRARIHRLPVDASSAGPVGSPTHPSSDSAGSHADGTNRVDGAVTETVATQSIEAVPPTAPEAPLALVAADGTADPHVLVLGIPASSTQPGSAIGAAPGIPSPLLTGADIAARSILADLAEVVGDGVSTFDDGGAGGEVGDSTGVGGEVGDSTGVGGEVGDSAEVDTSADAGVSANTASTATGGGDNLGKFHSEWENFSHSFAHDHSVNV